MPSLASQMQSAQQSMEGNRLGDAQAAQQAASQTLDQVQAALAESADGDLDRLAKRLKETEQAIAELANAQEKLQKQTADPPASPIRRSAARSSSNSPASKTNCGKRPTKWRSG